MFLCVLVPDRSVSLLIVEDGAHRGRLAGYPSFFDGFDREEDPSLQLRRKLPRGSIGGFALQDVLGQVAKLLGSREPRVLPTEEIVVVVLVV